MKVRFSNQEILNGLFFIMITLLPNLFFLGLFVFLFFREIRLDHQRFLEQKRAANEHVLREVEKFLKEQESKSKMDVRL